MNLYIDCQFETILACPLCMVALWFTKELNKIDNNIKRADLIKVIDTEIARGAIVYEEYYLYPHYLNQVGLLKALKTNIEFLSAKHSYTHKTLNLILCRDRLPDSNYYKTTLDTNSIYSLITRLVSTTRREWLIKTIYAPYYKQYNLNRNLGLWSEDLSFRIINNGLNHLFILDNLNLVGLSWNKSYKKLTPQTILSPIYPGQPPSWWSDCLPSLPFGSITPEVTGITNPSFISWVCTLSKPHYSVNYLFIDTPSN